MPLILERPVVAKIADELFRRLESLVAVPNDFIEVCEVIRPQRLGGYTPKHLQIVITRGDEERVTDLDCPGNPPAIAKRQVFEIRCHIMPSEKDTTPLERYRDAFVAIVESAVRGDESTWYSMGGNAIDTEWESAVDMDSDGSFAGVMVPVAVTYRHSEGNPNEARA
jgi:hypothetical protein